jgi:hypothetical protein
VKASNLYRTAALRLSKPLREPTRAPSLAERNRIERSPHDGATVFETARGADPSTLLDELAGSRWCRSPCPCEHHSGSGRGREPSRLTAHEWRTAVVMLHKPWRAPIAFQAMPARLSVNRPRIGTPARIRTENLRVLSAAPLPYWATGAKPGTRDRIRTDTVEALDLVPPAYWATRAWCEQRDSNPHWTGFKPAASGCWTILASPIPVLPRILPA